jgi:DNA-directed RNA polymerase specialized sigma24 family protein
MPTERSGGHRCNASPKTHRPTVVGHLRPFRTSGIAFSRNRGIELLLDNDIMAAMQALPREFRAVVYYADGEVLSDAEITAIMNSSCGIVMSRLHRGRANLSLLRYGVDHPDGRATVLGAA